MAIKETVKSNGLPRKPMKRGYLAASIAAFSAIVKRWNRSKLILGSGHGAANSKALVGDQKSGEILENTGSQRFLNSPHTPTLLQAFSARDQQAPRREPGTKTSSNIRAEKNGAMQPAQRCHSISLIPMYLHVVKPNTSCPCCVSTLGRWLVHLALAEARLWVQVAAVELGASPTSMQASGWRRRSPGGTENGDI